MPATPSWVFWAGLNYFNGKLPYCHKHNNRRTPLYWMQHKNRIVNTPTFCRWLSKSRLEEFESKQNGGIAANVMLVCFLFCWDICQSIASFPKPAFYLFGHTPFVSSSDIHWKYYMKTSGFSHSLSVIPDSYLTVRLCFFLCWCDLT